MFSSQIICIRIDTPYIIIRDVNAPLNEERNALWLIVAKEDDIIRLRRTTYWQLYDHVPPLFFVQTTFAIHYRG